MTGSQTLAFAIFHVKVLATLRPARSCDAPGTSNILFIFWKLYMNATSSRFIEPNAMVSTYDPSKNQLQALDPTAVEDWWWAELIYGIWATYSQVQAQNDESLFAKGRYSCFLPALFFIRKTRKPAKQKGDIWYAVGAYSTGCVHQDEEATKVSKIPNKNWKEPQQMFRMDQHSIYINISQYCVVSLCWFCASDWLDQHENSGRAFFYKARKFPVLARTPRRVFCSIPARWSQTSMVLPLLKPSNTWEPCGRRGKPGLVETSKRRVAVFSWKWGIPATSTIPPICGYSNIWEMDFNGF